MCLAKHYIFWINLLYSKVISLLMTHEFPFHYLKIM